MPIDDPIDDPEPGQFTMLYVFGVGEVPISVSGCPRREGVLMHSVRAVGAISRALCRLEPGEALGVRGPFGVGWDVASAEGSDVLIVAGGIGLAPLRPVIREVLAGRERFGSVAILIGARTPDELLYADEIERWRALPDVHVEVTVDAATQGWTGNVGLVTTLLDAASDHTELDECVRVRTRGDDPRRRPRHRGLRRRRRPGAHLAGTQLPVRSATVRPLPAGAAVRLCRRPGRQLDHGCRVVGGATMVTSTTRPTIAVWKFASCDGCQLTLLDCEDELLAVTDRVQIAYFLEATRATIAGPYDLSIVEGSVTTEHDIERIRTIRESSRFLVTVGACATSGGIQALRNYSDIDEYLGIVYATPSFISTLATSTPISDHVHVDFELRGCPIDKHQLLEVLTAFLGQRRPNVPGHSVCVECKLRGNVCVMVSAGTPCLGPITHAGCGALCPSYARGCYGCFGPAEDSNPASMSEQLERLGVNRLDLVRMLRTFNTNAEPFRAESERIAAQRGTT